MPNSDQIIFILDKIGIITFAFTGTLIGIRKRLDIFGVLMLGIINALGGGIIRDLILARTPLAISQSGYFEFAIAASALAIIFTYFKIRISNKVVSIFDTLGLGAFSAAGTAIAINLNLSLFHTIFFAIVTAIGGGIIRDILINEIPFIMKKEIYATAVAIGAIASYICHQLGVSNAVFIGALVTILIRLFAIKFKLNLPIIK